MSYDQWKTGSPYDDDPDWIEIAEKWINNQPDAKNEDDAFLIEMVRGLLKYLDEC